MSQDANQPSIAQRSKPGLSRSEKSNNAMEKTHHAGEQPGEPTKTNTGLFFVVQRPMQFLGGVLEWFGDGGCDRVDDGIGRYVKGGGRRTK